MTSQTIFTIDGYPAVGSQPDRIPEELKVLPWGVWAAEPRPGQPEKFNKAPRNPTTGIKIGANNSDNFGTFEQAVKALNTGKYSGIGVLLTQGFVGIDIDNYETTIEQQPEVKAFVLKAKQAGAYCELSPSGKGLRLFMRGRLPGKGRKSGSLEIYDHARFLTVTGKCLRGSRAELIDRQDLINEFLALLPQEQKASAVTVLNTGEADPAQVEGLCKRAKEKRPRLWAGEWEQSETDFGSVGYPSQSEADMAMCGYLAREAVRLGVPDNSLPAAIMAVFETSGLWRQEKRRQVGQYAIPKAVASALEEKAIADQKAGQITEDAAGAELAECTPGDIEAGKQFARALRGKLIYASAAERWLGWNGNCWEWCACGQEMAAAKRVAGKILDYATQLYKSNPDKHKRLHAFASSLQNLKRLEAMIKLAKSEPGMSLGHMSELDNDPWLLGVRNGVVNLRDGGLLAPNPEMLITRQCAAEYHDDAQCPRWLEFLNQIFEGDTETIEYIQRALGYTLTGVTTEEVLFICVGHGANGKSVFANVVSSIAGDYAKAAPASLLTVRRADDAGPRNDLAMLCGARLVSINETQTGDRLDEQVVKMLAGRETLSARFLHKEFFDFQPTAKPWLRTNHRPIITGEDDGIWRRIHLIPLRRKFEEHERDPWLETRLLEERDGILAWVVRGCVNWQKNGLRPSTTVRCESATYRKESDLLGEFLDERTQADRDSRVEQARLFMAYKSWHEQNGTRSGSKTSFTRKLKERGIDVEKSNGQRFYVGLSMLNSGVT